MEKIFFTVQAQDGERLGDLLQNMLSDKSKVDFTDCDISYSNDINALLFDNQDDVVAYLTEIGLANFINLESLNEAVVEKGAPQNRIIPVLQKYLTKIGIDTELILVDPFFFAPTSVPNYAEFIEEIFRPFLPLINEFIIITTDIASKTNVAIKTDIINRFKVIKPGLNVTHRTTAECHDRFIISHGREKGMLIGTSFNGLGNKLALIDRINTTDVRVLVKELSAGGLL